MSFPDIHFGKLTNRWNWYIDIKRSEANLWQSLHKVLSAHDLYQSLAYLFWINKLDRRQNRFFILFFYSNLLISFKCTMYFVLPFSRDAIFTLSNKWYIYIYIYIYTSIIYRCYTICKNLRIIHIVQLSIGLCMSTAIHWAIFNYNWVSHNDITVLDPDWCKLFLIEYAPIEFGVPIHQIKMFTQRLGFSIQIIINIFHNKLSHGISGGDWYYIEFKPPFCNGLNVTNYGE